MKFLPKPIRPVPGEDGPRRGFVFALILAVIAFLAVDLHAQVGGGPAIVFIRGISGTTVFDVGDSANTAIRVNVVAGSAGGPTHVDDAAFTVAVDDGVPMFALADETTPDSVDEGDAGTVRMSLNRNLYVRIRDNAGNERGVNVTAANELNVLASAQPGVDIGDVTINNASGASAVNVQDGGNSLTVDMATVSTANNDGALVSVTTTSGAVLASFATRKFAAVCNRPNNTDTVFLKLGATATSADFPVHVGQCFNLSGPLAYTGQIDGIAASGTQSVSVVEW